jgi:hypothetical protein
MEQIVEERWDRDGINGGWGAQEMAICFSTLPLDIPVDSYVFSFSFRLYLLSINQQLPSCSGSQMGRGVGTTFF